MLFNSQLLFFFSALGAFNGLILGLYFLFFARPKHISNYFLGALLLVLSVRTGKSVFFYFNSDLAGIFLQIGISACAFIGPFLYFYLKSMTTPEEEFSGFWKYHLMFLVPVILIFGFLYPWETNPELWSCYVIEIVYYEWLIYLIAAAFIIKKVYQQFKIRKDKMNSVEIWLLSLFFGNAIIWIAYNTVSYTSYIVGALSFSFLLYLLGLLLFFNKKKDSILFKKQAKYADKKIADSEATHLFQQLETIMSGEELYKNPNLKLPDVAKKLHILPHRLSQLINDNMGKSFSSFINEYRVNAAKQLLQTNDTFTLEAIGYECGFNSRSSFYATFKKFTGTTPAKYKSTLP